MQDLSLHLLDIIENAVRAEAQLIQVSIIMDEPEDRVRIVVQDDGVGMDAQTMAHAQNPFFTTKKHRKKKVGLGIPLLQQNAEQCNGFLRLKSTLGQGTELNVEFQYHHIDRMPLGNIGDTMLSVIIGHPKQDFTLRLCHILPDTTTHNFFFDTQEFKKELGDVPFSYPDVMAFLNTYLENGVNSTTMEET